MKLGVVGLGRIGSNVARYLTPADHGRLGFDADPRPAEERADEGSQSVKSSHEVDAPSPPRTMWPEMPAHVGEPTVRQLGSMFVAADALLEGESSELHPYECELADVAEPVPY
jgi:6-phosphogluconate dehydrogenase (decarboxylating)